MQLRTSNSLQVLLLTANGTHRMITKTGGLQYYHDIIREGEIRDIGISLIKPTEEQNLTRLLLEFTPPSPLKNKSSIYFLILPEIFSSCTIVKATGGLVAEGLNCEHR